MTEQTTNASKGLLESLTTLAATLVSMAHTRLHLLSSDLEEDRQHWLTLFILALVTLFCIGVGTVLATILLVVAFWDTDRILVLSLLAAGFWLVGITAWLVVIKKARTKPRIFAASLSELIKDQQHLTSRS